MALKKILIRRDTTGNFTRYNPLLSNGEFGIEICPNGSRKIKIGNGYTEWNELGYAINEAEYAERLDHIHDKDGEQDLLLGTLQETIANLETGVSALQETNRGQGAALEDLIVQYTETLQGLSVLTADLAEQEHVLAALCAQVAEVAQNQVTNETISAINQSIATYAARVTDLKEVQATQGEVLDALEDTQASQEQTLSTLAQGYPELQDQLQGIDTAMSVVNNGLQQVLNQYRTVADTVNELIAIKLSLPGTLGAIENRITNLAQTVEEEGFAGKAKDTEQDQQITSVQSTINLERIHRIDGDSAQAQALEAAVASLNEAIHGESAERTGDTAALDAKIDGESEARTVADTALQNHIDTLLEAKVDKEPGKGRSQNDFTNAYLHMLQALVGELNVFHDGIAYHTDGYEDIVVTRYMLRSDLSVTNSSMEIQCDRVQFRAVATSATNLRTEVLSAVAGERVTATIRRNSFYNSSTEGKTIQNRVLDDSPYIIDSTIYVDSNDYSIYQIFVGGHWWEINLWPANGKSVVLISLERRL